MANTLYDLLEVSTSASPESVAASYQRLHAHYVAQQSSSDGEDATNRLIALREAYTTLSNAERRKAYDEKLAARAAVEVVQVEQPHSALKLVLLAAVIGVSGLGYANYQSKRDQAALEKERVTAAAAVRLAEIEAQRAREQEERDRVAARQADYQRQQAEARERYERERDLAYGRQISRDIQRGEAMAQQEKQREEQRKLREEQQRQYEAERRLAQDKATVRRMEAENNRRYY